MVGMVGRMVGRCRLPDHRMVGRVGPIVYRPALPSNHSHSFHENYLILSRPFVPTIQGGRGLLPVYRTHPSRSIDAELPDSLIRSERRPKAASQIAPLQHVNGSEPREHRIPTANSGRLRPAKIVPPIARLFSVFAAGCGV